jgi:hypothetical protein
MKSSSSRLERPAVHKELHRLARFTTIVVLCLVGPTLQAQSTGGPIDGLTLSLGLGIYQGELDRNLSDNPVEFFALGEFSLAVHADRAFTPRLYAEGGLVYHRFNIDVDADNGMGVNVFAFDLNAGIRIGLFGRPGFLRVFGGVAPTMIATTYNFSDPGDLRTGTEFDQTSPRFIITFPVGIVLQDAWRFGVRFTTSDFVDSARVPNTGPDVISSIHVGYRFQL